MKLRYLYSSIYTASPVSRSSVLTSRRFARHTQDTVERLTVSYSQPASQPAAEFPRDFRTNNLVNYAKFALFFRNRP
jgi:hypothetical protein